MLCNFIISSFSFGVIPTKPLIIIILFCLYSLQQYLLNVNIHHTQPYLQKQTYYVF